MCVLQRVILRVRSPDGPSSHQPLRQPRVPQRGAVRRHGNRPPLPVSPRLRGRTVRDARQRQLCQPRVLLATSLQSALTGDQHQPTGASWLFNCPLHGIGSDIFFFQELVAPVPVCASHVLEHIQVTDVTLCD